MFEELCKAILLERLFQGYVKAGQPDTPESRREMWNRLCRHTGAPTKQIDRAVIR